MTKITTARLRKGALFAGIALGLAACSSVTVPDTVFFEAPPSGPEDFVGRSFPVIAGFTDDEGNQTITEAGLGSAEFISEDEIRVQFPGQPLRIYRRVGSSNTFEAGGDAFDLNVFTNGSITIASRIDPNLTFGGVIALAGFETPLDDRPLIATYGASPLATVFIAVEGDEGAITIGCGSGDCMDLTANFLNGSVNGAVIDSSTTLGGVTVSADIDYVNGQITDAGFEGGSLLYDIETSSATLGTARETGTAVNASVIGRFYGDEALQIGMVYEGQFVDEAGDTITFSGGGTASQTFDPL